MNKWDVEQMPFDLKTSVDRSSLADRGKPGLSAINNARHSGTFD